MADLPVIPSETMAVAMMVVMVGNDDNVRGCMYHRAYRQLLLSRAGLPLLERIDTTTSTSTNVNVRLLT